MVWYKRLAAIFLCISLLSSSVFAISQLEILRTSGGQVSSDSSSEEISNGGPIGDESSSSSISSDAESSSSPSSSSSSSKSQSTGKGESTSSQSSSTGESQGGGSGGSSGGGNVPVSGEVRAVWLTYINIANIQRGKTAAQFRASLQSYFAKCKETGLNTVFFHVRAFGDALYPSSLFPWSYLTNSAGIEGQSPGYDPVAIMIEVGHQYGLSMHAWFNPYRGPSTSVALADSNKLKQWGGDTTKVVIASDGSVTRYYYNPASPEVRQHIINGVLEVVRNYDVDGIHLDDYFYPTTSAAFDQTSYDAYRAAGGTMNLTAWRQDNVNQLVKNLYASVKSVKNIPVSIAPQGNMDNNINGQYANVPVWMANAGYVDWVIPQLYWGYTHSTAGYSKMIAQWSSYKMSSSVKLVVGLGIYRLGDGQADWTSSDGTYLVRMIQDAKAASASYKGFSIYEIDYLFKPVSATELGNLKAFLKS